MPTMKPRICVTLEKRQYDLLSLVASQQKKSMSALIGELVTAVAPSYERLSVLLEQASRGNDELLSGFAASVERAEEAISEVLGPSIAQHDLFLRAKERAAEKDVLREIAPSLRGVGIAQAGTAPSIRTGLSPRRGIRRGGVAAQRQPPPDAASGPPSSNTGVRSRKGHAKTRRGPGRGLT